MSLTIRKWVTPRENNFGSRLRSRSNFVPRASSPVQGDDGDVYARAFMTHRLLTNSRTIRIVEFKLALKSRRACILNSPVGCGELENSRWTWTSGANPIAIYRVSHEHTSNHVRMKSLRETYVSWRQRPAIYFLNGGRPLAAFLRGYPPCGLFFPRHPLFRLWHTTADCVIFLSPASIFHDGQKKEERRRGKRNARARTISRKIMRLRGQTPRRCARLAISTAGNRRGC